MKVGVLGGGRMGSQIAWALAYFGNYDVAVVDPYMDEKGLEGIVQQAVKYSKKDIEVQRIKKIQNINAGLVDFSTGTLKIDPHVSLERLTNPYQVSEYDKQKFLELTNTIKKTESKVFEAIQISLAKAAMKQKELELLIRPSKEYNVLKDMDVIIEAVTENLKVKEEVWRKADEINPESYKFSNSSSIGPYAYSKWVKNPEKVAGLHFFNPLPKTPLVEIIKGKTSSQKTLDVAFDIAINTKRVPIYCMDSPGFVVNSLLFQFFEGAFKQVETGIADIKSVDKGMQFGANHPMGPFFLADYVGLKVLLGASESMKQKYVDKGLPADLLTPSPLLWYVAGHLGLNGMSSGLGFYIHGEGLATLNSKGAEFPVNPLVEEFLETNRKVLVDYHQNKLIQTLKIKVEKPKLEFKEKKEKLDPSSFDELYNKNEVAMHNVNNVAVLTIQSGKMNPIGPKTVKGLEDCLEIVENSNLKGLVMCSKVEDEATSAGANIKQFFQSGITNPDFILSAGQKLSDKLEYFKKPVVSALHGFVLGGGSEIFAVPQHYVFASPDLAIGQPEKNVGIVPGWGGFKLIRKIGHEAAEEVIVNGWQYNINEALNRKWVDEMVWRKEELIERGVEKVLELSENFKPRERMPILIKGSLYNDKITGLDSIKSELSEGEYLIRKEILDVIYFTDSGKDEEISEQDLFGRERKAFKRLSEMEAPKKRLTYFATTGKVDIMEISPYMRKSDY